YIAANIYTPGDGGNLVLVNPESGQTEQITHSSVLYINGEPSWSQDSQKLYFFSDREGISNIYVYDRNSHEIHKLTSSYRGLEFPFVTETNLYYTSYYSKGTDIRRVGLTSLKPEFVEQSEPVKVEKTTVLLNRDAYNE